LEKHKAGNTTPKSHGQDENKSGRQPKALKRAGQKIRKRVQNMEELSLHPIPLHTEANTPAFSALDHPLSHR